MNKIEKENTDQKVLQATNDFMAEIEKKSDFPAVYMLAPIILSAVLVYFDIMPLHLTSLVTMIYPVYWTVKAIEHQEKDDTKQWYTYWSIWGYFFLLDAFMPNFLRMIPFFYFSKLLFFTWLFLPSTQGALFLYRNYFSRLPFDFSFFYRISNRINDRINMFLDKTFGIKPSLAKKKDDSLDKTDFSKDIPVSKNDFIKQEDKFSSEFPSYSPSNTESSETHMGQPSRIKDLHVQAPPKELNDFQHESRQNIVGNAKIDTDKLKTDMQNVRDQFSNTFDKFREVRENIGKDENVNTFNRDSLNKDTSFGNSNLNDSNLKNRGYQQPNQYEKKVM